MSLGREWRVLARGRTVRAQDFSIRFGSDMPPQGRKHISNADSGGRPRDSALRAEAHAKGPWWPASRDYVARKARVLEAKSGCGHRADLDA